MDPRAAQAIDDRAVRLLGGIRKSDRDPPAPAWQPDVVTQATLTEKDIIGEVDAGRNAPDGKRVSLDFVHQGHNYTLEGPDYDGVHQLVAMLLKSKAISQQFAERTVERVLRDWLRKRFRGAIESSFCPYALSELAPLVAEYRVWVPIQHLHLQHSLKLGTADVLPISQDVLHQMTSTISPEDVRARLGETLLKYQGHAAVVAVYRGDPERVRELGIRLAQKTLAALTLLSPAAFSCLLSTSASLWESKHLRQATTLLLREERLVGVSQGVLGPPPHAQMIRTEELSTFAPILHGLHHLLLSKPTRALATKVVDALQVYYRAIASSDPAETLIYVFVALEMILVRDANEPLQDNVATRIAFLVGSSLDDRRSIVTTIKSGYALRSKFVHHGARVADTQAADQFLVVAWRAFVALLDAAQRYQDQNELISTLEDRKLQ